MNRNDLEINRIINAICYVGISISIIPMIVRKQLDLFLTTSCIVLIVLIIVNTIQNKKFANSVKEVEVKE